MRVCDALLPGNDEGTGLQTLWSASAWSAGSIILEKGPAGGARRGL